MNTPENTKNIISMTTNAKDLAHALSQAQGEMEVAIVTGTDYEQDLLSIIQASRPALTRNGFSVLQTIEEVISRDRNYGSYDILNTILLHSSGQSTRSSESIGNSIHTKDYQLIAYYRMITYQLLVGVVTKTVIDITSEKILPIASHDQEESI